MDLGVIEITEEEAAKRVAEYESVLEAERSAEDAAILSAYRAAKRGLPVISLTKAFQIAGYHTEGVSAGLPKLAIVRADAKECWVECGSNGKLKFASKEWDRSRGALVGASHVVVDTGVSPPAQHRPRWRGHTIVPLVPPRHRPKKGRLHSFHILWEVDEWTPVPPKDPALLRHIRGDLWSVQAVWDLTEMERLVLSQRRTV
jgi:hypothetical protein